MKNLTSIRILGLMATLGSPLAGALELEPCHLGSPGGAQTVKAECGVLAVPENRAEPARTIELKIARVRSNAANKRPDPLLMLAGGPGQSALQSYVSMHAVFAGVLAQRDVVLVDQRGTGGSNPLNCEFADFEATEADLLADPEPMREAIRSCAESLDADPVQYTTTNSIHDLEAVRQALGIERWNLLGISYGTRKALTYMKLYPDALRAVVLDGVVPQQEALLSSHERNLQAALRKIGSLYTGDATCGAEFGDVFAGLWRLLDRLEEAPETLRLADPVTGEMRDFRLDKLSAATALRMFSYSANTIGMIPLLIHRANNGSPETLAYQAITVANALSQSLSSGLELSVVCSEDEPFYGEESASQQNFFGEQVFEMMALRCNEWPHIDASPDFKAPVASDLPVLLLSGELDPVTPPAFAERAAETLTNARHLVVKGQGHNVFVQGCMPGIMAEFIEDPAAELDTDCMQHFDYTPFFINLMGPKE